GGLRCPVWVPRDVPPFEVVCGLWWLRCCGVGVGARSGDHRDLFGHDFHGALTAIDDESVTGFDGGRGIAGTGHGRQIVFAADNGCVAHHAADIGDGGLDLAEDRTPARRGNRSHQDLPGLDFGEFIGVHDDTCGAFDFARRSRHALELAGVTVVTGKPLVDLFGGDAPQHAGKRFGDRLRWRIQRGCRASGLERVNDLATARNFFWPLHRTDGCVGTDAVVHHDIEEHVADLVAVQVQHVVGGVPQAKACEHVAQFADLAPEHTHRPVFDVEVVVFYVRVGGDGQLALGFKDRGGFFVQQVAVLFDDAFLLSDQALGRAHDVLAVVEAANVVGDIAQRDVEVLQPVFIVAVEPVANCEIEPWYLSDFPLRQPLLAAVRRGYGCQC